MKVSELISQLQALPEYQDAEVYVLDSSNKAVSLSVVNQRSENDSKGVLLAGQEGFSKYSEGSYGG